jgi:predicted nucleic acid-binding protein
MSHRRPRQLSCVVTRMTEPLTVVLDTNVLEAAFRSRRGASFAVLSLVGSGRFEIALSVPLVLEYEGVLLRRVGEAERTEASVRDLLDYLCSAGRRQLIFFRWRPTLRDPSDDMVLELAVAAGSDAIVTHNRRHFRGVHRFGIRVLSPAEFLDEIGDGDE